MGPGRRVAPEFGEAKGRWVETCGGSRGGRSYPRARRQFFLLYPSEFPLSRVSISGGAFLAPAKIKEVPMIDMSKNIDVYVSAPDVVLTTALSAVAIQFEVIDPLTMRGTGKPHNSGDDHSGCHVATAPS